VIIDLGGVKFCSLIKYNYVVNSCYLVRVTKPISNYKLIECCKWQQKFNIVSVDANHPTNVTACISYGAAETPQLNAKWEVSIVYILLHVCVCGKTCLAA